MPRPPVPATAQPLTFTAPIGGLDTVSPGTAMPPENCALVWNWIPDENGLRSRLGYREWCTNVTGTSNDKVRALLSFAGSEPSQNRLFATVDTGIYAASTSTASPTLSFSFASSSGNAGYGVFRNFVTAAGHFGLYCDEVNGYHVYSQTGASWAAVPMGAGAGQVSGVDPADLVHVTTFKLRPWFTERDSASAWYLDVNAIYGVATEFNFGAHFRQGGFLVGLYGWSYDGGAGVDDALVAVSSGGDVVVCQGVDPSDANSFNVRGTWTIAPPPEGREIAFEVGGDLWILSGGGIIPISRLVVGSDKAFETSRISNLFAQLMTTRRASRGWSMAIHPEDNAILVLYPDYSTETEQCLAQSQAGPRGWFRYRDFPAHCAAVWEGRLYFGTQDGRVCVARDYLDNVQLADPDTYDRIDCTLIPAFQRAGGNRVSLKQIRALFLTDGANPDIQLEARYDLDQTELATPDAATAAAGTWDNAVWDSDVWGGTVTSTTTLRGAVGIGHSAAAAVRTRVIGRTTLVQLEATAETGSFL